MDPANGREALRETLLDVDEGADMVMVKPAAAYLDVIARVRGRDRRAARRLPRQRRVRDAQGGRRARLARRATAAMEVLTGIARAGADLIITYYAEDAARWIAEGGRMTTTAGTRVHHKPDEADRELLNALQAGLAFVREPFAEIGERIGMDEEEVLRRLRRLKDAEIVRQLSAIFDTRALGYESSLSRPATPRTASSRRPTSSAGTPA